MHSVNEIRKNLAAAYRILAHMEMDNLTYTHLSARVPGQDSFYIYPFGYLYSEVTPVSLLHVDFDGKVLEGSPKHYNPTGYALHSAIYRTRPDLNAIFHLHTTAGVAVSTMKNGLLPISQFALHFYNRISYHDYDSLALDTHKQEKAMKENLGQNKTIILRNHGTITCGTTIPEAFFYTHHLEEACKVQCLAMGSRAELIIPDEDVCEAACRELLSFEKELGERDWLAVLRQFRIEESFAKPEMPLRLAL
jgi:ribulose-5-phosphate 4-epimerase/fuculose-1-phosphate aldolase